MSKGIELNNSKRRDGGFKYRTATGPCVCVCVCVIEQAHVSISYKSHNMYVPGALWDGTKVIFVCKAQAQWSRDAAQAHWCASGLQEQTAKQNMTSLDSRAKAKETFSASGVRRAIWSRSGQGEGPHARAGKGR